MPEKQTVGLELQSVFDIAGKDEAGIAKSFGVILRKDKTLMKMFINDVFKSKFRFPKSLYEQTEFSFEKNEKNGRTDIEIENDEFHVIIEAKIKTNNIKFQQANKYCKKLAESNSKRKCFVFLTEFGNLDVPVELRRKYPKIEFTTIFWNDILKLLKLRKSVKVNLIDEYENYLIHTRKMKIYDIEIWAVVVKEKQLSNFDEGNYYLNNKRHSPIFIAKRVWDENKNKIVINELRPVIKINDPNSKLGKKLGITKRKDYVYELGEAIKLANQKCIKRGFTQNSAIAVKFEDLINL